MRIGIAILTFSMSCARLLITSTDFLLEIINPLSSEKSEEIFQHIRKIFQKEGRTWRNLVKVLPIYRL